LKMFAQILMCVFFALIPMQDRLHKKVVPQPQYPPIIDGPIIIEGVPPIWPSMCPPDKGDEDEFQVPELWFNKALDA